MQHQRTIMVAGLSVLAIVGTVLAQSYSIEWRTIDGGGDMWCAGGDYTLSGTIGQSDSGAMTGGTYTLAGGFWLPMCPGDLNDDGLRNFADFTVFSGHYGSASGDPNYNAEADFNADGLINFSDFTIFSGYYGVPCP